MSDAPLIPEGKPVSHYDIRLAALQLAVSFAPPGEAVRLAEEFFQFLILSINPASSKSDSKPATSAKGKAVKASSASTPAASEPQAASSSTSAASESTAPKVESSPASGTSPESKLPSVDDVRAALTARQTRDGGNADKAREILGKYAKTGTLGSLAEGDRQKVITECAAAS